MPNVALDILGESYESRAKPLENQRTLNMYPEITTSGKGGLMSFPSPVEIIPDVSPEADRGLYDFEGAYYQVVATSLYSVDLSAGTQTLIGSIGGSSRCTFASNAGVMVIANGEGQVYQYNSSTSTLSEITDADLESPFYVAQLNNQWIYPNNKTTGRWVVSNAGDAATIDGLNYASAESNGDVLHRPYVFRQQLLLFGKKSLEPWWNTSTGSPPFDRQEGGIIEKGLGADYSIAHSDEALYFLGDDLRVYQMTGGQLETISTDAIAYSISQYAATDDAIGSVIQIGNQDLYIIQFPTAGVTWAYSQQKRFWSQLSSGTQYGRLDASAFAFFDGDWYFSSFGGGIYRLDYTAHDDNGGAWIRERVTKSFDSEAFGVSGREVFWNSITIRCSTGQGTTSGQGENPMLMLDYSDDDGRTWEGQFTLPLGVLGNYAERPQLFGLSSSWRRKWRIRVSDPVNFNLFEIKANVDIGLE